MGWSKKDLDMLVDVIRKIPSFSNTELSRDNKITKEALKYLLDENKTLPFPGAVLNTSNPFRIIQGATKIISLPGDYFTQDTTIKVSGIDNTVLSVTYINSQRIDVEIEALGNAGFYDIEIKNGEQTSIYSNMLEVYIRVWTDFRLGGRLIYPWESSRERS